MDAKGGNGTIIQDNVFIGPYTEIHDDCIVMTGAIIGSGIWPKQIQRRTREPTCWRRQNEAGCEWCRVSY